MRTNSRLVALLTVAALVVVPLVLAETSSLLWNEPPPRGRITVEEEPQEALVVVVPFATSPRFLQDHENEFHNETEHTSSDDAQQLREDLPWGEAVGAALLVNVASLVGLVILIPTLLMGRTLCAHQRKASPEEFHARHQKFLLNYIPSFGAGALLAAAAFLIIPEAILLLSAVSEHEEHDEHRRFLQEEEEETHEEDNSMAWKFGTSFLGGYVLPLLLGSLLPTVSLETVNCPVCDEREATNTISCKPGCQEEECPCTDEECANHLVDPTEECGSYKDEDCLCPSHNHHHHHDALDMDLIVEEETAYLDDGTPFYEKSQDPTPNMPVVDRAVLMEPHHSPSTELTFPGCANNECTDQDCPDNNTILPAASHKVPKKKKPINWKLAISLILGDAFHNFADGIFLGNAFLLCSRQVAYAIVAATIYHELAQELADYFLLTTHCGLKPLQALVLNFLSGLSVLLGVVIIFALPINATATGIILSISAGVYVYIAASECLPRVEQVVKNLCDRLCSMLCFVLGAVPIGLVLLSHGHCDA